MPIYIRKKKMASFGNVSAIQLNILDEALSEFIHTYEDEHGTLPCTAAKKLRLAEAKNLRRRIWDIKARTKEAV